MRRAQTHALYGLSERLQLEKLPTCTQTLHPYTEGHQDHTIAVGGPYDCAAVNKEGLAADQPGMHCTKVQFNSRIWGSPIAEQNDVVKEAVHFWRRLQQGHEGGEVQVVGGHPQELRYGVGGRAVQARP